MSRAILLVGVGAMAEAYASVLRAQRKDFRVIGRSAEGCERFRRTTGIVAATGGIEAYCERSEARDSSHAIVAVGVEHLARTTGFLLRQGLDRVLVEKPAGLYPAEVGKLAHEAAAHKADVFVAYNRRFYASTRAVRWFVQEDGGVRSVLFEFTEWADEILQLEKGKGVKENWLFANSSHVIDLAFHLGGPPESLCAYTSGTLPWHPKAAFAGAGRCRGGALFAYHANWDAPGRWGVEIMTQRRRLILRPLEILQIQKRGSMAIDLLAIDDELDRQFKPGIFEQVRAFLGDNDLGHCLCTLAEQADNARFYQAILRGDAEEVTGPALPSRP